MSDALLLLETPSMILIADRGAAAALANPAVPTATMRGRLTAGDGPQENLTPAQGRSLLNLDALYAALVHTHSAADITSGTLLPARGGTGANLSSALGGRLATVGASGVLAESSLSTTIAGGVLALVAALSANRSWTFPDRSDTVAGRGLDNVFGVAQTISESASSGATNLSLVKLFAPATNGGGLLDLVQDDGATGLSSGHRLGSQRYVGRDSGGTRRTTAAIAGFASETWGNGVNLGTYIQFAATPTGSSVFTEMARIVDRALLIGATSLVGAERFRVALGSTPATPAATDFLVGNGIASAGTGFLTADGTAAAPSFSFAADTDTGFYRIGSNTVGMSFGGVLVGTASQGSLLWQRDNATATTSAEFILFRSRTGATNGQVASGDRLGGIRWQGLDDTGTTRNGAFIAAIAQENFTATGSGSGLDFYTVAIGSTTITTRARIHNDGGIEVGDFTGSPGAGTIRARSFIAISATLGMGYGAGAGGTVAQATSKATGVTLNKRSGAITMNGAALAAATSVGFTLTNSAIGADDVVLLNIKSGATADAYTLTIDAKAAGSCRISLRNVSAGSLSEAVVISFDVFNGAVT